MKRHVVKYSSPEYKPKTNRPYAVLKIAEKAPMAKLELDMKNRPQAKIKIV